MREIPPVVASESSPSTAELDADVDALTHLVKLVRVLVPGATPAVVTLTCHDYPEAARGLLLGLAEGVNPDDRIVAAAYAPYREAELSGAGAELLDLLKHDPDSIVRRMSRTAISSLGGKDASDPGSRND